MVPSSAKEAWAAKIWNLPHGEFWAIFTKGSSGGLGRPKTTLSKGPRGYKAPVQYILVAPFGQPNKNAAYLAFRGNIYPKRLAQSHTQRLKMGILDLATEQVAVGPALQNFISWPFMGPITDTYYMANNGDIFLFHDAK